MLESWTHKVEGGIMMKKFAQITLTAMLVLAIAACGGGGSGGNGTSTGSKSADGGSSKGSGEMPKIYIYQNTGALNQKPEGSVPDALEEMKQMYMEELGIEPIAIVPPKGSEGEKLNLLLGSKDQVDVFQGDWDQYASKGAIIPLNDLLEEHGQDILKAWPQEAWDYMTDKDGTIWGIPRGLPSVHYPVWIRTDWLKKLGLEMPKTIDELEAVMKAFQEGDPDGNGKADTIPMMTDINGINNALMGGFVEGGNSNWLDPADNKIKPVELAPGYKDFLAKMADWYQKGYIYKEAFAKFDPLELLKTNRVGMSSMWYSRITLLFPQIKPNLPEGADYAIARELTGPAGKLMTASRGNTTGMLVTKKAKNPEAVIKFINYQYKDLPTNTLNAAFGKNWKYLDDQKFEIELLSPELRYAGEYMLSLGLATENKYAFRDPVKKMHADYLNHEITNIGAAKMPLDATVVYDKERLKQNVPMLEDLDRLRSEELVKFVTGVRPLSEFDQYIEQLNKAGLQMWIDEYTKQYHELKK